MSWGTLGADRRQGIDRTVPDGFQRRLDGGEKVDHSTAGAAMNLSLAGRADLHMAELIALAIAGHHGGMPDRRGGEHSTLDVRLETPLPALAEGWRDEVGPLPAGLAPSDFTCIPTAPATHSS